VPPAVVPLGLAVPLALVVMRVAAFVLGALTGPPRPTPPEEAVLARVLACGRAWPSAGATAPRRVAMSVMSAAAPRRVCRVTRKSV
jgi:hypothetical protein